ncbi:tubby-related protein 3-like [Sorex araneus]|uniref:tubby-related protein 3-like n=1 Tax=Sorex araneus TaxID=42254 RepID=UPI002433E4FF|nr:tubby-related protein 3-like [Sorex araneus]
MRSRQLHSESRAPRASQESQESPDERSAGWGLLSPEVGQEEEREKFWGASRIWWLVTNAVWTRENRDVCLQELQQILDHQRELLEKRQRRKVLDPRIIRPNPAIGLPLAKQRTGEHRFHLRSSSPPATDFILPGAVDPVATTRPNKEDPNSELPAIPLNTSAGTSTAIDAVGTNMELPVSSQDSSVTVEEIDEWNEERCLRNLRSKKFFNIHDVAGSHHKDLVPKTSTPSLESLSTVHEIDGHVEEKRPVKLTSKKFFNIHDFAAIEIFSLTPIAAQVITDSEEEDKEDQESTEVILKRSLSLSKVEKPEGTASLMSAKGLTESFETAIPELKALWASLSHRKDFAYRPAPQNVTVRCQIIRDINSIFPGYSMFVEVSKEQKMLVLAARKYKRCMRSEYMISTDIIDLYFGDLNYVGRLRSNLMKTKYTLYNNSVDPNQCRDSTEKCSTEQELGTITYLSSITDYIEYSNTKPTTIPPSHSIFRMFPPRPPKQDLNNFIYSHSFLLHTDLQELFRKKEKKTKDNAIQLNSKNPFGKLKTQWMKEESEKIFQLTQESEPSRVVMQLEHGIKNQFVLEYSYPLSPLQAFAIALSRFDRG